MRLVLFSFFLALFSIQCKNINLKENNTQVVLQYLDQEIKQRGMDMRIGIPPPPPGINDSVILPGRMKPDSVINKLSPLNVYIQDSITYFDHYNLIIEPIEGFTFINEAKRASNKAISLDISALKPRKGIILHSISRQSFDELLDNIRLDEDYGGLVSIKNLFISKNGDKAYFEAVYFKSKHKAATYNVYAEIINGKWDFKSEQITES